MSEEADGTVVIVSKGSVERAWVDPGWTWQVYKNGALALKALPDGFPRVHFERGAWDRVWTRVDGRIVADASVMDEEREPADDGYQPASPPLDAFAEGPCVCAVVKWQGAMFIGDWIEVERAPKIAGTRLFHDGFERKRFPVYPRPADLVHSEPTPEFRGRLIKAGRMTRGWSQVQLAQAAGLSTVTVNRLETGKSSDDKTVQAVYHAFHAVDVEILPNGVRDLRTGEAVSIGEPIDEPLTPRRQPTPGDAQDMRLAMESLEKGD